MAKRTLSTEKAVGKPPQPDKKTVSFSLTANARRLLMALKSKHGISATSVVELAIREKAERDNIK
jgi:hypothetical protein